MQNTSRSVIAPLIGATDSPDDSPAVAGDHQAVAELVVNDENEGADRRGDLIKKIVAQGLAQPDLDAWMRSFTVTALLALAADKASSATDIEEARRQIHDLARLASNEIRAERIRTPRAASIHEETPTTTHTSEVA